MSIGDNTQFQYIYLCILLDEFVSSISRDEIGIKKMIVDTAELLLTKLYIYSHETLDTSSRGRLKAWGMSYLWSRDCSGAVTFLIRIRPATKQYRGTEYSLLSEVWNKCEHAVSETPAEVSGKASMETHSPRLTARENMWHWAGSVTPGAVFIIAYLLNK